MDRQRQPIRKALLCGLLAFVFILAACGDEGPVPAAQELLQQSQTAMTQVKSYHFNLATENPGQSTGGMLTVKDADGDIEVPNKLKATGTVIFSGFPARTELVVIDDVQYYKNPLSEKWEQGTGLLDPRVITSPDTGIPALLGNIQDPTTPQSSEVDGTPCWSIDGKLDTKYIQAITGMTPGGASKMVDATVCIGKADDHYPYLIRINGEALEGDKTDTVRDFKFSKFNEPVDIQAPAL